MRRALLFALLGSAGAAACLLTTDLGSLTGTCASCTDASDAPAPPTTGFTFTLTPPSLQMETGEKTTMTVNVQRSVSATGPIRIDVNQLPPTVTATPLTLPANVSTGTFDMMVTSNATPTPRLDLLVVGSSGADSYTLPLGLRIGAVLLQTSSDAMLVVPSGLPVLRIEAWGGGGGGGGHESGADAAAGGGGGYARGDLVVSSGDVLEVRVGGGGGGCMTNNGGGGGGGGYSAVLRGMQLLVLAGGGGGGGRNGGGGPGGGPSGLDGYGPTAGFGGTQTDGGAPGYSAAAIEPPSAGASLRGGTGCCYYQTGPYCSVSDGGTNGGGEGRTSVYGAGGGGGGLFGGGGGGHQLSGGGGGSGYLATLLMNGVLDPGAGPQPAHANDPFLGDSGVGWAGLQGGTNAKNGNPGRVVIHFPKSP